MDALPAKSADPTAQTVAAIDVGANALRMVIAEVFSDGRIEPLEQLHRAVRLGQDTFRRGRLGGESMRAAVQVLRDYRQLLDLYKVEKIRAVATTAVREASNGETFLDRVFMATRLNVEVIDTSEESRLTVSAVRQAVGDALGVNQRQTLIADVGGGSTLLTLLENGEIDTSQSLRLGSIRLQEMFSTSEESPRRSASLLRQHISNTLSTLESVVPLGEIDSFVAVGRRCAVRRPRGRHALRLQRIGGDRRGRFRQARRTLRALHGRGTVETPRPALRRGRNAQSGAVGLSAAPAQDEGPAGDRLAHLHARRPAAGTGARGDRQGGHGAADRRDPFGHGDRREVSRRSGPRPKRRRRGRAAVRPVSAGSRAGPAAAVAAAGGGAACTRSADSSAAAPITNTAST